MKPIPFLVCFTAMCALVEPASSLASVVLDAPGHVASEGAAVVAHGGEPGAPWRLVDWRGREVEGAVGVFDERGETTLPPLKAGYYRMAGGADDSKRTTASLATLAVVSPFVIRHWRADGRRLALRRRHGHRLDFAPRRVPLPLERWRH